MLSEGGITILTQGNTSKNLSRSFTQSDANGNQIGVLHVNATYSTRNVTINIDIQDSAFYAANKAECDKAIAAFKAEVNAILDEQGLPNI
jgi:hypothetical protein